MHPDADPVPGNEMTPPRATPPAAFVCAPGAQKPVTLRHRPEFLKAASARRQGTPSFLLQGRDRADGDPAVRQGFTASKKIGNAVLRNRAKRRLRAIARAVLAVQGRPGWDYVLVARPQATVSRPYADLLRDLETALRAIHPRE